MKIMPLVFVGLLLFSCQATNQPASKPSKSESDVEGKYGLGGIEFNDSLSIVGGYGSDMFPHPQLDDAFYLLTDRGPNYEYKTPDGSEAKGFSQPSFTPQIGLFQKQGDKYFLVKTILLKGPSGKKLTGLPNLPGKGGTNESAYDLQGNIIANDPNGIDPEGLVVMENGDFWVSDEYGPYLMRFDSNGVMLEKFAPFEDSLYVGNGLPRVLAKRRPNRGMEGLTLTPSGSKLVGIMQSSLYNPNKSVKSSCRICRIMTFDLATSQTQQFAFIQERPGLANSAICALSEDKFLVIERDSDFPFLGVGGEVTGTVSEYKMIVEIDLEGATDISDPENGALGLRYEGKTIEQLKDAQGLAKHGIIPVKKRMRYNLLQASIPYTHDKAEGLAYFSETKMLAIVNDNDFGIDSDGKKVFPKKNREGELERTEIYFLKMK